MVSKNCRIVIVLKIKEQIIAIIAERKVIDILYGRWFSFADFRFCRVLMQWCQNTWLNLLWNAHIAVHQPYQRYGIRFIIMLFFMTLVIVVWSISMWNLLPVYGSRHRNLDNFVIILLSAVAEYCCFPKKQCINVTRTIDTQIALFWTHRAQVNLI